MGRLTVDVFITSNENKMSDGGRERASLGVEVISKVERAAVRRSLHRMVRHLESKRGVHR
jgi:hypothetical protein